MQNFYLLMYLWEERRYCVMLYTFLTLKGIWTLLCPKMYFKYQITLNQRCEIIEIHSVEYHLIKNLHTKNVISDNRKRQYSAMFDYIRNSLLTWIKVRRRISQGCWHHPLTAFSSWLPFSSVEKIFTAPVV